MYVYIYIYCAIALIRVVAVVIISPSCVLLSFVIVFKGLCIVSLDLVYFLGLFRHFRTFWLTWAEVPGKCRGSAGEVPGKCQGSAREVPGKYGNIENHKKT